jgi:hypothetical protein
MSEQPLLESAPPPPPPPPSAPPQSHVLCYITGGNAPPRVRQVASWSLLVVGLLLTVPSMLVGVKVYSDVSPIVARYFAFKAAGRPVPTVWKLIVLLAEREMWWLILGVGLLLPSIVLLICFRPVRRGNGAACYAAGAALLPILVATVLAAAAVASWGLLMGTGIWGRGDSRFLPWLIPVPVLILAALLLVDLLQYLRWIATNPIIDKPPASFLPRRSPTEPGSTH